MASNALTILGPGPIEFTSIDPTTVVALSGDTITCTGRWFNSYAISEVTVNGELCDNPAVVNSTTLTFDIGDAVVAGGPYSISLVFTGYPANPVVLAAVLTVTE